jgi:hypothetical protein
MTKSVIAIQTQIEALTEEINNLLRLSVINLSELAALEAKLHGLESQLEFLIDSGDRSE